MVAPQNFFLGCLLLCACSKPVAHLDIDASTPDDASFDAALAQADPVDAGEPPPFPPPPAGEARRYSIATLETEALLAPALPEARKHFTSKGPFNVQASDLSSGRKAFLVTREDGSEPYLAVVKDKKLAWSHEKPTAGISPPVLFVTITANARSGVSLFAYDPPTHIVLGRVWDEDGTPFADFQLLEAPDCAALSAASWPGHGVFVVASLASGPRAQLLAEDGTMAFPRSGLPIGVMWRSPTPVAIVVDTPSTVMLAMHGKSKLAADRILMQRYDGAGTAKWPDPVGVDITKVAKVTDRIDASLVREGVVRVAMPDGEWGRALEVDSTGHVVRLSK